MFCRRCNAKSVDQLFAARSFGRSSDEFEENYEKPPLYSLAAQKAQQLADIEKELPPHCERNLEEGMRIDAII